MQNSEGAALHPLLNQRAIAKTFTKGENPLVDSYSAFFDNGRRQATALNAWLLEHRIAELIIMGLASDYCVKFTVLDALESWLYRQRYYRRLPWRQYSTQDSAEAFMEMAAAGATLYTLDDWLETHR